MKRRVFAIAATSFFLLAVVLLMRLLWERRELPKGMDLGSDPVVNPISRPITSKAVCVTSYPTGSCWTIEPPSTHCADLATYKPAVSISADGSSSTIIVPATAEDGVPVVDSKGRKLSLHAGDEIDIETSGLVKFDSDHCVDAEGLVGWYDPFVDSPFNQNVGGLEFSIGSLTSNRYFAGRHYAGVADYEGVPIFRVIDRRPGNGMGYRGDGALSVRLKVKARIQ